MQKISIIIPVYNVEKYIKKCLDSVINQTYKNIEIIVIDDGSTDKSSSICDEYAKKDKRIRVIHQENKGLSGARNTGLKYITGDYITFIDSDDYVEKDYVEYLYNLIIEDDYDISACNFVKIYEKNIDKKNGDNKYILNREQAFSMMLDIENNFTTTAWAKLYKKNLFKDIKFPENEIYEDIETTGNILLKINKMIYSEKPKYNYYIRIGSLSYSNYSIQELDRIKHSKELIDKAILKFPKVKEYAIIFYISNLIAVCNKQLFSNIYKTNEIKYTKKYILKNIIILIKSKFSLVKKLQIILFVINVKLYLKLYLFIKKDKYY